VAAYFLSYARADQVIALRFADDLIAAGASVWVDQYDIHPSQHWDRAVETAVRGCQGLIVMLSPRSAASPNVADEVSVAIDDGKTIIPILIEACKPPLRMARMQFIDATRDYQTALAKCLATLAQTAPTVYADGAPAAQVSAASLPPETLRQAELRLTGIIGPVAGVLVRQAAGSASESDLYQTLAKSIRDEAERKSFLAWLSHPTTPGRIVTPRRPPPQAETGASAAPLENLEALSKAFTRYMGPIAAHLVAREAKLGGSRDALYRRLAERIANEKDRAAFLREATKA
jgi:TIR domain